LFFFSVNNSVQILIVTLVSAFNFELAEAADVDFYHLGGNSRKYGTVRVRVSAAT
jgi:hypothetical protein